MPAILGKTALVKVGLCGLRVRQTATITRGLCALLSFLRGLQGYFLEAR